MSLGPTRQNDEATRDLALPELGGAGFVGCFSIASLCADETDPAVAGGRRGSQTALLEQRAVDIRFASMFVKRSYFTGTFVSVLQPKITSILAP